MSARKPTSIYSPSQTTGNGTCFTTYHPLFRNSCIASIRRVSRKAPSSQRGEAATSILCFASFAPLREIQCPSCSVSWLNIHNNQLKFKFNLCSTIKSARETNVHLLPIPNNGKWNCSRHTIRFSVIHALRVFERVSRKGASSQRGEAATAFSALRVRAFA